jgi:hypothetical protein
MSAPAALIACDRVMVAAIAVGPGGTYDLVRHWWRLDVSNTVITCSTIFRFRYPVQGAKIVMYVLYRMQYMDFASGALHSPIPVQRGKATKARRSHST